MAVRGVPDAGASLATLHDLGVVAHWLSRTLARNRSARWRSRGAGEQDATEGEPAAAKRRAPPGGGGRDLERAEVGI
jgi:hypothetical protein